MQAFFLRSRYAKAGLFFVGGCLLLVLVCLQFLLGIPRDFCQYYFAGQYFLHHQSIYTRVPCGVLRYESLPPTAIWIFLPFAFLDSTTATMLWNLLLCACYLSGGLLFIRLFTKRHWSMFLLFLVFTMCWPVFYLADINQNVIQILFLLFALSFFGIKTKRPYLSGIAIGIAALIKIWPILMLVVPLMIKQKKIFLSGLLTVGIGTLVSFIANPPNTYVLYWHTVRSYEEQQWIFNEGNLSLSGFVTKLFVTYDLQRHLPATFHLPIQEIITVGYIVSFVCFLGGIVFLYFIAKRAHSVLTWREELLFFCISMTMSLLIFPLSWDWGLLVLGPGMMLMFFFLPRLSKQSWLLYLLLGIGFVAIFDPVGLLTIFPSHNRSINVIIFMNYVFQSLGLLSFAIGQGMFLQKLEIMSINKGET